LELSPLSARMLPSPLEWSTEAGKVGWCSPDEPC
jgi:hypothetical protein